VDSEWGERGRTRHYTQNAWSNIDRTTVLGGEERGDDIDGKRIITMNLKVLNNINIPKHHRKGEGGEGLREKIWYLT
jgi:hypothetical protein